MNIPLNYRVRVDLSQFYNDARRLSYIYIDGSKITNILHLQTKIQNIFGITRPFYLVVNDVFLPVNEDVRIIKDDEVVIVKYDEMFSGATPHNDTLNDVLQHDKIIIEDFQLKTQDASEVSEDPDISIFNQSQQNTSVNDVQIIDANIPHKKRKRIRRRKPKKEPLDDTTTVRQNGFNSASFTTILEDIKPPTRKHMKFNWDEQESENKVNETPESSVTYLPSKPVVRSTEITSLSTLLNLKSCRQPVTFSAQRRVRTSSRTPSVTNDSPATNGTSTKMETTTSSPTIQAEIYSHAIEDYSNIKIDDYPLYTQEFQVNDVMAFKILTINENYCPILSDFIVAKIVGRNSTSTGTLSYICKIILGYEQLKTPNGKFALPTEEECEEKKSQDDELLTMNAGHMDQPRLLYRPTKG